jgi:hypothetical protein
MNMPKKTKDGPKARKDLEDLKIRKDLHRKGSMEETETETEEGGKGQKSQQAGGELLPSLLLHLKFEGDRSIHQLPYENQSQFQLLWEDKQISRHQEEKVQHDEVS